MPDASPWVCPVLIEREHDLAVLRRLLVETQAGSGRLALITGEAGAGKSRLARELAAEAATAGFLVLTGGCTERDPDFPFAPFLDALRQHLRRPGVDPVRFFGSQGPTLPALLPELHGLFPATDDLSTLPPEQSKRRLFEALAALFDRLTANQPSRPGRDDPGGPGPLLLLLEDLHWADPTSLELLELLPRRLAAARVLIAGTLRPDEPNDALARTLAALRRARMVSAVALEPLTRHGVARMLAALLPAPPMPAVVDAIHARTEGNPFFVEELLATAPLGRGAGWTAGEPAVPHTVRDTVLRRLAELDEDARTVADIAAVAGSHVSFELLLAAGELPVDRLTAALQALIERRILVEERVEGRTVLRFRHALTRDAIERRLSFPRRRTLHRTVGAALADRVRAGHGPPVSDADLGYHFHAAEWWDEALVFCTRAADAARAVHATVAALTHYRRALDAARALGRPETAELHRRCGQALALLGAFDAARQHLDDALRLAREQDDSAVAQAALYELAGLYASRDYRTAERLAEEALALARAGDDRRRQGLALNRLGNIYTNVMRFADGLALHQQALAIFEALSDPWGSADSLDLIGMTRYLAGEVPEARAAFGRAAAIFRELGDKERLASALTNHGLYVAQLDGPCAGDAPPSACRVDVEEGLRLCREIGWRAGEAYALTVLASVSLGDGRYAEAFSQAESALAIATEIEHPQWMLIAQLILGLTCADLFDDAGALAWFRQAAGHAHAIGSVQWAERLDIWVARSRVRLGEPDAADILERLQPAGARPQSIGQRRALFALAEVALAQGDLERALALTDRQLAGAAGSRPPAALLQRADALAALGRVEEADAALDDARRLALELGPRPVLWRVAAARARLWRGRDPARAEEEAALTRAELASLAECLPDERRAAFLQAPEVAPWLAAGGRRRTAAAPGPGGLTAREQEVAACVAGGMSNKAIARALFLSEKTVEMHVGSCLGKLGFTSRAQLAAWAVAHGLAQAPS